MQSQSQIETGAAPAWWSGLWLAALALWRREVLRFVRQRHRVVSALLTPLVIWLLLGSGLNNSLVLPQHPDDAVGAAGTKTIGYLEYFFPGTIMMILLFTAIFSTISVIEDRREGFLQGVLVAPIPRMAIVLGKVLGGASIATIQGALVLLLWPFVAGSTTPGAMLLSVCIMFVLALGLTGLGLCIAWPMDSTQGFHAIMMLLLMPMWFLSGALFPPSAALRWVKLIMYANPLTYGQAVLRIAMGADPPGASLVESVWIAATVMIIFTMATVLLAGWLMARPPKDRSQ